MSRKRKSKRKATSTRNNHTSVFKPVFAFLLILVFIAAAFYLGTQYDSLKKTAQKPEPSKVPGTLPDDTISVTGAAPTEEPDQKEMITLTLYYPNAYSDSLIPEQRQVEIQKGESLERVIFEELRKSSVGEGGSLIPEGTRLISAETRDGICYLNLSQEFADNMVGGSSWEEMLLNSIVNSLTELSHVKKVQFLINGQKSVEFGNVTFDEPFERNESIIKTPDQTSEAIEARLRELGENTLKALRDRDMAWLSSNIHPDKKLRFSPYTYIDLEKDLTFGAGEIKGLMNSGKVYTWGAYDGSGDPIRMTFAEYMSEFVYDKDFLNAEEIIYNQYISRGNTVNNILEAYPDGKLLEYYFSGFDPQYGGLDWESLKLIFEEKDGQWYLVGIIHDSWTI